MEDLISVIVPVYNGEKYIEKCVEAICNSSYQNLEILLINDGSKDHSEEICQNLAQKDHRIKVFSKENGGIASARQFGLSKATGKYICFSDQDDTVYPHAYELLKKNLEFFNSDICIGSADGIRGKKIQKFLSSTENKMIENEDVKKYVFHLCNSFVNGAYEIDETPYLITIWNCMYKKEIIDQYGITFKRFIASDDDYLFNLDYISHVNRVSFEKESVYGWVIHLASFSHNPKFISNCYTKYHDCLCYITDVLKRINNSEINIDFHQWENACKVKAILETVINEGRAIGEEDGRKNNKERIDYLEKVYLEANADFSQDFLKKIYRDPAYLTYRSLKTSKGVKKAYYLKKYFYNLIVDKILYLMKIVYYHF